MAIGLFIGVPIFYVLAHLFTGAGDSWQTTVDYLLKDYLINSFRVGGLALSISFVFGVSSAWFVSTYEFPLRKLVSWLLILPLAIPVYIMAYAYAGLFDYTGYISKLIGTRIDILTWWGLALVLSFSLFPYVYLSTRALFSIQNGATLESARILSSNANKVFFKIGLPLALPAIAAGGSLVLMEVLNDYGAASYYNIETFSKGIFKAWMSSNELNTATFLAAILCLIIFIIISLERYLRSRKRYSTGSGNYEAKRIVPPKQKQALILSWLVFILTITLILPVIQLVKWASFTFRKVLDESFFSVATQSVLIALIGSILCVTMAVLLLSFSRWNRNPWVRSFSKISVLGYAIPGAVIATGILVPTLSFDNWLARNLSNLFDKKIGLILNGTLILLMYGYIIRFMAVSFSPIQSGYDKVHLSITEVSDTMGINKWKAFFSVELPMIKYSLISAWLLVFVDIMKELPLTLILKPTEMKTLAVEAHRYAMAGHVEKCAPAALLIILVGAIPVIFLNRLIK